MLVSVMFGESGPAMHKRPGHYHSPQALSGLISNNAAANTALRVAHTPSRFIRAAFAARSPSHSGDPRARSRQICGRRS